MSCAGHKQEYFATHPGDKLKVTAVIKNLTVEELGAIMNYLREYRRNRVLPGEQRT